MKHPSGSERGQAVVILALMMIVLLAFASLAIDGGNAYVERRRSQNAADAAALAGARQLWIQQSVPDADGDLNNSEADLLTVINQAAVSNGIAAGTGLTNTNVVAYYTTNLEGTEINPNQIGSFGFILPDVTGVQVKASRQFNTFVGGFFSGQSPAASAQATAVIIPPVPCGSWAIYADASQSCPPAHVSISGGGQGIKITNGGVYSNGSMDCNTNKATVVYPHIWKYKDSVGIQCTSRDGSTVVQGTEPIPQAWDYDDFVPGGSVQTALDAKALAEGRASDYHSIGPDDTISVDGLYYLSGDARHLSIAANVHNVTIVANGLIQFSGGIGLSAYYNGLLLFSNAASNSGTSVKISGSNLNWQGLIYAPHGQVAMSASANGSIAGSINAACVDMSGAEININYDPASCVPQRAAIKLLK